MDEITNGFITLNAKSYFGRDDEKGNFRVEEREDGGKCKERRERTVLINAPLSLYLQSFS